MEINEKEQIEEWIKLLGDRFLKIHLLDLTREDLDLDRVFQIPYESPITLASRIVRFSERVFEIISIYLETNAQTTKKILQASPEIRLNPS